MNQGTLAIVLAAVATLFACQPNDSDHTGSLQNSSSESESSTTREIIIPMQDTRQLSLQDTEQVTYRGITTESTVRNILGITREYVEDRGEVVKFDAQGNEITSNIGHFGKLAVAGSSTALSLDEPTHSILIFLGWTCGAFSPYYLAVPHGAALSLTQSENPDFVESDRCFSIQDPQEGNPDSVWLVTEQPCTDYAANLSELLGGSNVYPFGVAAAGANLTCSQPGNANLNALLD